MSRKCLLNRRNAIIIVFITCLFMFCFLWYTKIYPISIVYTDDWSNIAKTRLPIPMLSEWNPAKVFPETYMPLMGDIGSFLIYPVTGDYLNAITLALGLGTSLIVVLYVESFRRLLIRKTEISDSESIFAALIFWLLHFIVFLSNNQMNNYLLGGDMPTNLYHYTIPSLLCFTVIFIMESIDSVSAFFKCGKAVRISLLAIMVYLAVFSNLFSDIILATYSFSKLLTSFFIDRQRGREFIKNNLVYFVILVLWAIALFFESHGGRAASLTQESSTMDLITGNAQISADAFIRRVKECNIPVLLSCIFISVLAIIHIVRKRRSEKTTLLDDPVIRIAFTASICIVVTIVYLYLLCLVARPKYLYETYVWIAFIPWLFILAVISLVYLNKEYRLSFVIPSVLLIMMIFCGMHISVFEENTAHNLKPKTCIALNKYLMAQIITADENGETEMQLKVPVTNRERHRAFSAPFHGERMAKAMFKHRLIHRMITVSLDKSYEVNKLFRLDEDLNPIAPKDNV